MKIEKQGFWAIVTGIIMTAVAMPDAAWAFSTPTSGTFGYEFYEFLSMVLTGGIGFGIALLILGLCIFYIIRTNAMGAIVCAVGAFILVKIEDIAVSLGAIIA
jgi:hypothetical protein